jgi:hypothetical protein
MPLFTIPTRPLPRGSSRNRPVDYFMLQEPHGEGPKVGTFAGQAIAEHMTDYLGQRYRFAGIAPRLANGRYDVDALRPGEWLVEPGLIYVHEPKQRSSK